jgi:lipopolysaccharide transport system ATP-binding protein
MHPIITVENLSKRYRIGRREPYLTLRESLVRSASAPMRALRRVFDGDANGAAAEDYIWALSDVSFEVAPGEVLGVIGRNGAGKSTLLKILSRITEPTRGRVELYGRIGSLLEIGTGFHPELTGRENIYLSGAILGMRRAEIVRKFDEIVAFAEVEQFIDTPVKHYSSGMYLRLAFAVAAHLEPEILLVDEVLAVGDAAFQKKCIGKMGDVAREGRTVLFVSHNMASIESLCRSAMLIKDGRLHQLGSPREVVARYLATELQARGGVRSLLTHPGRRPGSVPTMAAIELRSRGKPVEGGVRMGAPLEVVVSYRAAKPLRPVLGVGFKTGLGQPVFNPSDRFAEQLRACTPLAAARVTCTIERLLLMPGTYLIDLWLGDPADDFDVIQDALSFEVVPADVLGNGRLPPPECGPVFCPATFTVTPE